VTDWSAYGHAADEAVTGAASSTGESVGGGLGAAVGGPIGGEIGAALGGDLAGDLVDWIKSLFGCHGAPTTGQGYGVDDAKILLGLKDAISHHSHTSFCGQGDTDAWALGLRSVLYPIITTIGFPPGLQAELTKILKQPSVPEMQEHEGRVRADQIFWPGGVCPPDYHGRVPAVMIPWTSPAFKAWQANAQAVFRGENIPYPASVTLPNAPGGGLPPSSTATPMSTPVKAGIGIGAALALSKWFL